MSYKSSKCTKKYTPPPFTSPFVQIAQVEIAVIVVTIDAKSTTKQPRTKIFFLLVFHYKFFNY